MFDFQAAEKAAVEQQAELIAFDRANHMGISKETVNSIKAAIETEAAQAQQPGGAASVMNIKENEERLRELKVGTGAEAADRRRTYGISLVKF